MGARIRKRSRFVEESCRTHKRSTLQASDREFLLLFFPRYDARLDLTLVKWLDKELFAAALQGEVNVLDLVARLRRTDTASADLLTLVHIEVESQDAMETFRPRMYHYYEHLRQTYGCPTLPIAVYIDACC